MSRQTKLQEDTYFRLMKIIQDQPEISQRELAVRLGVSLGGINYCLKALIDKGFIKVRNFSNSGSKLKYGYLLTPSGLREKTNLTIGFLRRKMTEYEDIKAEIEAINSDLTKNSNLLFLKN